MGIRKNEYLRIPEPEHIFADHENICPAVGIETAPHASKSVTRPPRHRGCIRYTLLCGIEHT